MPAPATRDPLRPSRLDEFTGQPDVTSELSVILGAAARRQEPPPHLLFTGPQGLGKTTLAGVVAAECGLELHPTSGPLLEKPGDLVSLLVSLTAPGVVFIDEIHRLPKQVEETLYTAMEDNRIDLIVGEGRETRTLRMPIEPFTLVGATTQAGLLGGPFRDRFGHIAKLKPYDVDALTTIVIRSATLLGDRIDEPAAGMIASRSRGTPRIANRLLRRVRDYAHLHDAEQIDSQVAEAALTVFGVDTRGLDGTDRDLLAALVGQFNGGPVGLATLAAAVGEAPITLEEAHEPFLMRSGLLARTPRGRVATPATYEHLGLPVPVHLVSAEGSDAAGTGHSGGRDLTAPRQHAGTVDGVQDPLFGEEVS